MNTDLFLFCLFSSILVAALYNDCLGNPEQNPLETGSCNQLSDSDPIFKLKITLLGVNTYVYIHTEGPRWHSGIFL